MAKYLLLIGRHIGDGDRLYNAGDIVETGVDLLRFNPPGMQPKFQRVDDSTPVRTGAPQSVASPEAAATKENDILGVPSPASGRTTPADDGLDRASNEELARIAEEEEVDLSDVKDRQEAVARIRRAR
jgi:hypothetical protein